MPDTLVRSIALAGSAVVGLGLAVAGGETALVAIVAALVIVAHLVPVPHPSGRSGSLAPAVVAGAAIVTAGSPLVLFAAIGIATAPSWATVAILRGRRAVDDLFPSTTISAMAFVGVFSAGGIVVHTGAGPGVGVLVVLLAATITWYATAAAVRALLTRGSRGDARRLVLLDALHDWPTFTALVASTALFTLTVGDLGWWSVPLAGLPYAFSHVALHLVQVTRRTYDQTIMALGRIPEAAGHSDRGHAARTADLAVALGDEMRLSPWRLRRIEGAARLHDIGRVVLANPAVSSRGYSRSDVAGWSAAIIGEAAHLADVAEIVVGQGMPYRRHGEHSDSRVPAEARVVAVAARYDSTLTGGANPVEALEVLHRESVYDYDPEVVAALRRVLVERGTVPA